jgi:hypothetical protein
MTVSGTIAADGNSVTLQDDAGAGSVVFTKQGLGSYSISISANASATGAQKAALVVGSCAWMFLNVPDAVLLTGTIAVTNAAAIAMVANYPGVKRVNQTASAYTYALPIGRWAMNYSGGVPAAVSALQAAGQATKATALQAAWIAAGSPA